MFIFIHSVSEMMRIWADGTQATEDGRNEIRSAHCEELVDRCTSRDFGGLAWSSFLGKCHDYTECPMLEEDYWVTRYWTS